MASSKRNWGGTMQRVQRAKSNRDIPDVPGLYYWSEWKCNVEVVLRRGGLYVTPPNGIEIKVTPAIAGKFKRNF